MSCCIYFAEFNIANCSRYPPGIEVVGGLIDTQHAKQICIGEIVDNFPGDKFCIYGRVAFRN